MPRHGDDNGGAGKGQRQAPAKRNSFFVFAGSVITAGSAVGLSAGSSWTGPTARAAQAQLPVLFSCARDKNGESS